MSARRERLSISEVEDARRWAAQRFARLVPFPVWVSVRPRSESAREMYWRIVGELIQMITAPRDSEQGSELDKSMKAHG